MKLRIFSAIFFFTLCVAVNAREYCPEDMQDEVDFLCGPRFAGRATGTSGCTGVAYYIYQAFHAAGLDVAVQHVGGKGVNVIGEVPGREGAKTIIIMAYFDGLGVASDGTPFPGADSNASGVVALLELARSFAGTPKTDYNYIFVALDGHNDGLSGARAFSSSIERSSSISGSGNFPDWWNVSPALYVTRVGDTPYAGHQYSVRPPGSALSGRRMYSERDILSGVSISTIKMVVNLDTIGSSLSPKSGKSGDYLLALGAAPWSGTLDACNGYSAGMQLYYDYYGSSSFTKMFYRVRSDHRFLLEKGAPCVMFTSGITFNTNHVSDNPSSLNYPMLGRRLYLIESWLRKI